MLLNVPLYQVDIPRYSEGHVYGICYLGFNQGLMAIQHLHVRGDGNEASLQMAVQIWLLLEGK